MHVIAMPRPSSGAECSSIFSRVYAAQQAHLNRQPENMLNTNVSACLLSRHQSTCCREVRHRATADVVYVYVFQTLHSLRFQVLIPRSIRLSIS